MNQPLFQRALGLLLLGSVAGLSGCSTLRSFTMPEDENQLSGAGSILVKSGTAAKAPPFEDLDLDTLLKDYGLNNMATQDPAGTAPLQYRRNELQSRLIAASNQRCGSYLRALISSRSQTQMGWGGLSTLLSGAASVVTHGATSQALAAGSTVSNGYLSLYNEAYFNNLSISVIASGIDKRRELIYGQILQLRNESLQSYTVNQAIADALQYHSACNIISGLETAAAATKNISADASGNANGVAPKIRTSTPTPPSVPTGK